MFNGIMDFMKKMFRNEKGQGMVEYILIIIVVALIAFVGFNALGTGLNNTANEVGNEIDSTTVPNVPALMMVR